MENNKTSFHKFMDATQGVKVDLALVDELKTRIEETKQKIDAIKKSEKDLLDLFDTASRFADKLDFEYRNGASLSNVITKSIDRTKALAKELGIDANSLAEIKQVLSLQQELEKAIMKAESTIKAYRSL